MKPPAEFYRRLSNTYSARLQQAPGWGGVDFKLKAPP